MPELTDSMQDQYNRVMNLHLDLIYTESGGAAELPALPPAMLDELWNFADGFPAFLHKWLNCLGSLNWIIETGPEVVKAKLDAAEARVKAAYNLAGIALV
jgi:hypothetical protein